MKVTKFKQFHSVSTIPKDEKTLVHFHFFQFYSANIEIGALQVCKQFVYQTYLENSFAQSEILDSGTEMVQPWEASYRNRLMNKCDHKISGDGKLFSRYVGGISRSIHKDRNEEKLAEINRLHPSLRFTIEVEENNQIPFLDMKIIRSE